MPNIRKGGDIMGKVVEVALVVRQLDTSDMNFQVGFAPTHDVNDAEWYDSQGESAEMTMVNAIEEIRRRWPVSRIQLMFLGLLGERKSFERMILPHERGFGE